MSSPLKPTLDQLVTELLAGNLREMTFPRVELKSAWDKSYGEDISAIANHESRTGGWLIVGVSDDGRLLKKDEKWAKNVELQIGNQTNQFLSPFHSVNQVIVKEIDGGYCVFVDVINPGDVTDWDGEAYKVTGTSSTRMKADERIALSMRLPGDDFTNQDWDGQIDSALVLDFAKKVASAEPGEFPEGLANLSSIEILSRLHLHKKTASGILFGEFPVRIGRYDDNEDVIENVEKQGTYYILTDEFISQIQTWTRMKGTVIEGNTSSATEEQPYPPKVLREVLANAVAHALYQRENGGIIVDIYPDHLTIRNNAMLDAKAFSRQWFAKKTYVRNKLLMTTLRAAKITDELGTGKARIFRLLLESGKKEPLIEFTECGTYGKWEITISNHEYDGHFKSLSKKLYQTFPAMQARIAVALVLWKEHKWSSILERLDDYFTQVAIQVVKSEHSPVVVYQDSLFIRRWADVALLGQESRSFTPIEENRIYKILSGYSLGGDRNGFITTTVARGIIGLGQTPAENTQLSNLFRKWRDQKLVEFIKRGHWRFVQKQEMGKMSDLILPDKIQAGDEEPN